MAHGRLTDAEERALTRKQIAEDARRGLPPSQTQHPELLLETFHEREDELAELEQVAELVIADRAEKERTRAARQTFDRAVKRKLDQWYREEQAELRAKAAAEVMEELGLKARP